MDLLAASATIDEIRSFFKNDEQVLNALEITQLSRKHKENGIKYFVMEIKAEGNLQGVKKLEQSLLSHKHRLIWLFDREHRMRMDVM